MDLMLWAVISAIIAGILSALISLGAIAYAWFLFERGRNEADNRAKQLEQAFVQGLIALGQTFHTSLTSEEFLKGLGQTVGEVAFASMQHRVNGSTSQIDDSVDLSLIPEKYRGLMALKNAFMKKPGQASSNPPQAGNSSGAAAVFE